MALRLSTVASAAFLATITVARADVYQGTYTAVNTGTGPYMPTIHDDGGAFLSSPFSTSLTADSPLATTFLQVAPASGDSSVGTVSGSIAIAMTLLGPGNSAVTGLSVSRGGNGATLANGTIDFLANYELFYGSQTDCLSWNSKSCTPTGNTGSVGETLTATFADGAVLDIVLYNWSDWNMTPEISFDLLSGPGTLVPEPASLAVFGVGAIGILGVAMACRRRGFAVALPS